MDRSLREVFDQEATPEEREAYENAKPSPNQMYMVLRRVVKRVGAEDEVMRRAHSDADLIPEDE